MMEQVQRDIRDFKTKKCLDKVRCSCVPRLSTSRLLSLSQSRGLRTRLSGLLLEYLSVNMFHVFYACQKHASWESFLQNVFVVTLLSSCEHVQEIYYTRVKNAAQVQENFHHILQKFLLASDFSFCISFGTYVTVVHFTYLSVVGEGRGGRWACFFLSMKDCYICYSKMPLNLPPCLIQLS